MTSFGSLKMFLSNISLVFVVYEISYICFLQKKNCWCMFSSTPGSKMVSVREYTSLQLLNRFGICFSNTFLYIYATILTCLFRRNVITNRGDLKQVESIWTLFWTLVMEHFTYFKIARCTIPFLEALFDIKKQYFMVKCNFCALCIYIYRKIGMSVKLLSWAFIKSTLSTQIDDVFYVQPLVAPTHWKENFHSNKRNYLSVQSLTLL